MIKRLLFGALALVMAGLISACTPAQIAAFQAAEAKKVATWDRLAQCESGGNWGINTGNGYYGGLQFNLQTWRGYGGKGYPHQNSKSEQIRIAERLKAHRGFAPWPSCSRKLGLR